MSQSSSILADTSPNKHPLTVAVVGQIPPPMNGQSLMIQEFLKGEYSGLRLIHVPMNFSRSTGEIGQVNGRKIWVLAQTLFGILKARIRRGATVLYYPPAGANLIPVLRDLVLLCLTRPFFSRTVFHFHAAGLGKIYARLPFYLKPLYRIAYGRPDLAIFTTKATSVEAEQLHARNIAIVPCGAPDVANEILVPDPNQLRQSSHSHALPTILFAGILCEGKGVLVLLEACRLLRRSGTKFNLQVLGEFQSPEFESIVRDFVLKSDLTSSVHFPGMVLGHAKSLAFQSASIFCFPSHYAAESFGVVLIEAMSFSLPIVATDWQGIPEVTGRDNSGTLLVPTRDSEALAKSLERLLNDQALCRSMGQHNRLRYLKHYTLSAYREALATCMLAIE
jgi:glycosyltransferase involved in cell wall biosynthesis